MRDFIGGALLRLPKRFLQPAPWSTSMPPCAYRPAYASGLIAIGRAAVVRAQAVGQVLRTALVKPATNRVAKAQARSWSPQLAMVRI